MWELEAPRTVPPSQPLGPLVATRQGCHTAGHVSRLPAHRQMVSGALAQTEIVRPGASAVVGAPTIHQRSPASDHLKCPPDTPRRPPAQGRAFTLKAPFVLHPAPENHTLWGFRKGTPRPRHVPSCGQGASWTLECCLWTCLLLGLRGLC